jgi:hypothetical protein
LKKGVEMVLESLRNALEEEGIEKSLLKEKPLILIFIKQYKLFQRLKIHQPIRL